MNTQQNTPKTPPKAPSFIRQERLPIFPGDGVMLGEEVSVVTKEDTVWYFNFTMPIFSHAKSDKASFRMYTSSLCDMGLCKLVDVERVFEVSAISVKRALKKYRTEGASSFFVTKKRKSNNKIFDEETTKKVQSLLDEGKTVVGIGHITDISADTIRRAINRGHLKKNI